MRGAAPWQAAHLPMSVSYSTSYSTASWHLWPVHAMHLGISHSWSQVRGCAVAGGKDQHGPSPLHVVTPKLAIWTAPNHLHPRQGVYTSHQVPPYYIRPPPPTWASMAAAPSCTLRAWSTTSRSTNWRLKPFSGQPCTTRARILCHAMPPSQQAPHQQEKLASTSSNSQDLASSLSTSFWTITSMLMATTGPAMAETIAPTNPFGSTTTANSLYVTLALIIMCVPGIWSQIKRAPKANKKRKVYEVDGPAKEGAMSLRDRAKQIVTYFKKYNYEVKEMGEVITFAGLYAADRGQAAAVTFYTFAGMASLALVLSLLVPEVGGWWYLLTLAAPGAWFYYFRNGERVEEVKVKMATSDDEQTTDIIIEGDIEEIERFRKELDLLEKGMVRVKGILENA